MKRRVVFFCFLIFLLVGCSSEPDLHYNGTNLMRSESFSFYSERSDVSGYSTARFITNALVDICDKELVKEPLPDGIRKKAEGVFELAGYRHRDFLAMNAEIQQDPASWENLRFYCTAVVNFMNVLYRYTLLYSKEGDFTYQLEPNDPVNPPYRKVIYQESENEYLDEISANQKFDAIAGLLLEDAYRYFRNEKQNVAMGKAYSFAKSGRMIATGEIAGTYHVIYSKRNVDLEKNSCVLSIQMDSPSLHYSGKDYTVFLLLNRQIVGSDTYDIIQGVIQTDGRSKFIHKETKIGIANLDLSL